jgi:hypothetical protein
MHTVARGLAACGLVALILAAALPASTSGQSQGSKPVFLALPNSFPELDARVALMIESGRDIVLLRDGDTDPETLEVALRVLRRMHRDHPREDGTGQLVPITGFAYIEPLDRDRRAELEGVLADLRQRPLANVGNLGLGRWMRFPPR